MNNEHFHPAIVERPNWEVFWPSFGGSGYVSHQRDFPSCATYQCTGRHETVHGDGIVTLKWSLRRTLAHARSASKMARSERGLPP